MTTALMASAQQVLRENKLYGITGSGISNVDKTDLLALFAQIDIALSGLGVSGAVSVASKTKAMLDADLAHPADTLALVWDDVVVANNGVYAKTGPVGGGGWSLTSLTLPATFAADLADALARMEAVEAAATSVSEDTAAAIAAAAAAAGSEAVSTAARGDAIAAAQASGPVAIFNTKATANAALAGLADQAVIEVMADESLLGRRTRYRKETGAYAFKVYVDQPVALQGADSYRVGLASGLIDPLVSGSLLVSASVSQPCYLGVNGVAPLYGDYPPDTGYVAGAANVSAVIGCYDSIANGLASFVSAQHSIVYSGTTHCSIEGGSRHAILSGADYSRISGGTQNVIEGMCDRSIIAGGSQCRLLDGVDFDSSGALSAILASTETTSKGRGSLLAGCRLSTNTGQYALLLGCNASSVTKDYGFAHGDGVQVGGARSTGIGKTVVIGDAIGVFVHGDSATVAAGHHYASAKGTGLVTPHAGAHVHTARNRGNIPGANQALEFNTSGETTTATAVMLRTYTGYPTAPANSVVRGVWQVTGVDPLTGDVTDYEISMAVKRIGTATPVVVFATVTEKANQIGVASAPTISVNSSGNYRVNAPGVAGKSIYWDAPFRGLQIVFA